MAMKSSSVCAPEAEKMAKTNDMGHPVGLKHAILIME